MIIMMMSGHHKGSARRYTYLFKTLSAISMHKLKSKQAFHSSKVENRGPRKTFPEIFGEKHFSKYRGCTLCGQLFFREKVGQKRKVANFWPQRGWPQRVQPLYL